MNQQTEEHLPASRITVDADFQAAIPPLSSEELTLLEESILRDGVRDALVVWEQTGILLDGHNRYAIAVQHGLPFKVVGIPFTSRDDAADWMDTNQLGRRNLTPDAASLLRGRRYNRTKLSPTEAIQKRWDTVAEVATVPTGNVVALEPVRTSEALAKQHGVSARTIRNDGAFAAAVDKIVETGAAPDMRARVMAGDIPSRQAVVEAAAPLMRDVTPSSVANVAEKLSRPHVSNNSGQNEWYTPPQFIEAARITMGSIDCDPATSEIANRNVRASRVFTCDSDGRDKVWGQNVWMNPPYAQPLIWDFCDGLAKRVESGEVKQAIVLVNNGTETAWFQRLLDVATAVCFVKTRIRFLSPGGEKGAPLQGQAILYAGDRVDFFNLEFKQFGRVLGRLP